MERQRRTPGKIEVLVPALVERNQELAAVVSPSVQTPCVSLLLCIGSHSARPQCCRGEDESKRTQWAVWLLPSPPEKPLSLQKTSWMEITGCRSVVYQVYGAIRTSCHSNFRRRGKSSQSLVRVVFIDNSRLPITVLPLAPVLVCSVFLC